MGSVHKDLLNCVLYNDTAESSYCLMSNVWLMGDNLMGGRKYNGCLIPCGYKPEGCGFDSRIYHWNFLFTYPLRHNYGPEVDTTSNRNECQEYFFGVKAAGALA